MQVCIAVQSVFAGAVFDRQRETEGLPYNGVINAVQIFTFGTCGRRVLHSAVYHCICLSAAAS